MLHENSRHYLSVGIDRATRLRDFNQICPMTIHRCLTDNGKEFRGHLFGLRNMQLLGNTKLSACMQSLVENIMLAHLFTLKRIV